MKILVVDDNEVNSYYLRAMLEGRGDSVQTAHNGEEGLALARATPPDLVVSDLLMPVMDGFTLLRHWHQDGVLSSIPFVIYTATYTTPEDERLGIEMERMPSSSNRWSRKHSREPSTT